MKGCYDSCRLVRLMQHITYMRNAVQVAKQEQELDEAYDALEKELRKIPCKNWHKVLPGPCLSIQNGLPCVSSDASPGIWSTICRCNTGNLCIQTSDS